MLNKTFVSDTEARIIHMVNETFVILPQFVDSCLGESHKVYSLLPEGFAYRSDMNDKWVSP